jgi:hypothetical protein
MSHRSQACAIARRRTATLLLAAPFLLLAALAPPARAASAEAVGATFPASVTAAGQFADLGARQPVSISADGRYVAFVSGAANLAPDAPAGVPEAYVKDLDTGEVLLASRAGGLQGEPADEPPPGEQPQTGIERAILSGDGRYLLFTSRATNLAGDELPLPLEEAEDLFSTHVYRRDLRSGETVLVDRETGPAGATHLLEARGEAISADGRHVLFRAEAPDLGDPGGAHEETGSGTIYVRDLQSGTTAAVSRASGADGELANARSGGGTISADGTRVAFSTSASNAELGGPDNEAEQVYLRDLASSFSTTMLSRSEPAGAPGDGESFEPAFLGGDCRVGFTSEATNLGGAGAAFQAYVRDTCGATPSTTMVGIDPAGTPFHEAALLGGAGAGLVLLSGESSPEPRHLFLRDLGGGQTTLLDRASGTGPVADRGVEEGAISANGCRVAFSSAATNLSDPPPPGGGSSEPLQVYVRQLAPCRPSGERPPGGGQPGQGGAGAAHAPLRVSILALRPPHLRLGFSAAGDAKLRVQRRAGRLALPAHGRDGARHPERWRLVASLAVSASAPGPVAAALPRLAPGRYRLTVRPEGPGAAPARRAFTVAAR